MIPQRPTILQKTLSKNLRERLHIVLLDIEIGPRQIGPLERQSPVEASLGDHGVAVLEGDRVDEIHDR